MLYGSNPQAVIEALKARHRSGGSQWDDGRRIVLMIEGGGMRSVLSAAGAVALGQLGMDSVFDTVVATSAGVMNASYMLSKQALLGIRVYFENCTTKHFLSPWRFWKFLDVDYIIDRVAAQEKPLDLQSLAKARAKFLVSLCDKATGQTHLIDVLDSATPVLQILKAAMAIPVVYDRAIEVENRRYVDAGTIAPFPLDEILAQGATDVLLLLTRPRNFVEQPPLWTQRRILPWSRIKPSRHLCDAYSQRHIRSRALRDLAFGRTPTVSGVNIATLCPDDDDKVRIFTTDTLVTHAAALQYGRKTFQAFDSPADDFVMMSPAVEANIRNRRKR